MTTPDVVELASMAPTKQSKSGLTDEHKAALAEGRTQGRAVRRYLEALEAHKPKRGRKRTAESVQKRLAEVDAALADASGLDKLLLIQESQDLEAELASMGDSVDLSALEDAFVAAAQGYGERKGISYATWRQVGVPAAVLARAGIKR